MPAPRLLHALPLALLAFAHVAGCGSSEPKRYAVTGLVKYKGSPIPAGTVTFTPEDPSLKSAGGAAIKDGRFEVPKAAGLLAGKYKVSVNYPDPKRSPPSPKEGEAPGESGREVADLLPAKYNQETELRAEVTADGSNDLTFDLK
jgi:hypothetical protein